MTNSNDKWGLPEDPERLLKWISMNALPASRWAAAMGARRACSECGVGIIDLLRFADNIGQHYSMTHKQREVLLRKMILALADSGLEVGVWNVPTICSACDPDVDEAISADVLEWAKRWLHEFEVDPEATLPLTSSDLHSLSLAEKIPELRAFLASRERDLCLAEPRDPESRPASDSGASPEPDREEP